MSAEKWPLQMLVNLYNEEKSVWKVCVTLGLKSPGNIYERLKKAGAIANKKRQPKTWRNGIPFAPTKHGYQMATTAGGAEGQ